MSSWADINQSNWDLSGSPFLWTICSRRLTSAVRLYIGILKECNAADKHMTHEAFFLLQHLNHDKNLMQQHYEQGMYFNLNKLFTFQRVCIFIEKDITEDPVAGLQMYN